jgi:hypothetical protein
MSLNISSLGTTDATYAHNKDRGGSWANYLHSLSVSNNHDRQTYNGEVNAKVGVVPQATDIPHSKIKRSRYKKGTPGLDESQVEALKKGGFINPRYQFHGDA